MNTRALGLIVFLASAASMALEIAAGRMIAPYVGMSLYSWTAVISVVLAGLALGHWIGGVLADGRRARAWLLALLLVSGALAFASQFVLRGVSAGVLGALPPVEAVLALGMAAFFLPSLTAGAVSPIATTLALEAAPEAERGRVLGRMYALGAFGAILGTVGSGLALIPWLGSAQTVGVVAAAYLVSAALCGGRAIGGVAALAAVLALGVTAAFGKDWSACERESGFFCMRVDDVAPGVRVLALDHLGHGANDREDPQRLHVPYVALMDAVAAKRLGAAPHVFFIGGGAFTLPRAWADRWPGARLTVAEIDREVTRLASERLWVDPARFDVRHGDARAVLASNAQRFDAIIGDAFADISIPPHLVSDEFFGLVKARLTEDGFFAMNAIDLMYRPRFVTSLVRTLSRHFEHVEMWLDETLLTPEEKRATWVLVASNRPSPRQRIDAGDGSERAWVQVPAAQMLAAVEGHRVLTDDHAPVARLLGPLLTETRFSE